MTLKAITNFDEDILALKGRVFNPSLMMIAPFIPLLIVSALPVSVLLLVLPILDFYSTPRKLCRKYILEFEKWYITIFLVSLACRLALEFVDIFFWIVPILIGPIILVMWIRFAWENWRILYQSAQ